MANTPEELAFELIELGTVVGLLLHLPAAAIGVCLTFFSRHFGE